MKRVLSLVIVSAMLVLFATSSVVWADKPTDQGQGILKNSSQNPASIINPHEAGTDYDKDILSLAAAKLYRVIPDESGLNAFLQGELADGDPIQMDDTGQLWRIKIKKDAKWANGDVLNADDVIYSFKMLLDPKLLNQYGATFANHFIEIENALVYFRQLTTGEAVDWSKVGIRKVDDHTIEIKTVERNTAWEVMNHFNMDASSPVYEPYYEKYMTEDRTNTLYGTDKDKFMSSGPFILTEWVKGNVRKYVKNPNYVNKDKIWLAGVETRVVPDGGTRLQLFEKGDLHYVGVSAGDLPKYIEDPRLVTSPSLTVRHIEINMAHPDKPILGNVKFRKALYHALDRVTYAKVAGTSPAPYVMSTRKIGDLDKNIPWRDLEIAQTYLPENYGYDPVLAKQLFDEAMAEEGLEKLTLTLNYYETRVDTRMVSELMQKDLPRIFGEDRFELKLQQLPNQQLFDTMRSFPSNPRSYDISWAGWGHSAAQYAPWKSFLVYTSDYDRKNAPVFDPELDALYARAGSEEARFNQDLNIEITAQLEALVLDRVYEIPVYEAKAYTLISDNIELHMQRWIAGVGHGYIYSKVK